MCPSAPRVRSEPGGQKPVLSLSLDLIQTFACGKISVPASTNRVSINHTLILLYWRFWFVETKWGIYESVNMTIISEDYGLYPDQCHTANKFKLILNQNRTIFMPGYAVENVVCKMMANLLRHRGFKSLWPSFKIWRNRFVSTLGIGYMISQPFDRIKYDHTNRNSVFQIIFITVTKISFGVRAPSQYKDRLIYVWRFPC